MNANSPDSAARVLAGLPDMLPIIEAAYKDVHAHPELSMQEHRTGGIAAKHLEDHGYEVTSGVGKTGVVGLLRNGDGPVVMLRADMDALPIREATDLDYASREDSEDADGDSVPVAHSCGHDMHVAWLMGASALLARQRDAWSGTLMAVFQPGEETAEGARAMIADGLRETIVSREIAATEAAVVTVGVLQAGTKENVIPDEAIIELNVRTFDEHVRKHVLEAVERIVNAEAAASGAPRPPEITQLDSYPLNVNDRHASDRVAEALRRHFPADRVRHTGPAPASEDFGCFGTAWDAPSVYWFVGGTDPEIYAKAKAEGTVNDLPVNHSPMFAPVIHPTLGTGVEAMVVGALAWLAR